jgi:uncharacterized protein YutE (UPF0331/DUF86 family)
MDEPLLFQKLESLQRCIQRVELNLPDSLETLLKDPDAQDIVSLNLTRAVQMSVDIASQWLAGHSKSTAPKTMEEAFEALANSGTIEPELAVGMRKLAGLRNPMIHNYDDVNWQIVFTICQYHLGDFRAFAKVFSDLRI